MEVRVIISRLETLEKSQVKVYVDENYEFALNIKEVEQYGLMEGKEITQTEYDQILENVIYPKALEKALSLLTYRDRSVQELRKKLSLAEYSEEIIDRVMAYVKRYAYLNEERFTAAYIRSRMNRKSKLRIKNELLQKGVAEELIADTMRKEYNDTSEEDAELTLLRKEIAKRVKDPEQLSYDQKQKLIAALYRKGFDIGEIRKLLS
jgi:regulatory protein